MGGKQSKKMRKMDKQLDAFLKTPVGIIFSSLREFKGMIEDLLEEKPEQNLKVFSIQFEEAFDLFVQFVGSLDIDPSSDYGKSNEPLIAVMDSMPSNMRKILIIALDRYLNIIGESLKDISDRVLMGELIESSDRCGNVYNVLYDIYCVSLLGKETYKAFINHVAEEAIDTAHFAIEEETRIYKENPKDPEPLEWANSYLKASENLLKVSSSVSSNPDSFEFISELFSKLDETGKDFFMNEHLMGIIQTYEAFLEDGELSDENKKYLYLARQIFAELDFCGVK